MFKNVEGKLKILSKILIWVVLACGIIMSIVYAVQMDSFGAFMIGIVMTAVLFLMEYVCSLFIFAFAELVENSKEISKASKVVKNAYELAYPTEETEETEETAQEQDENQYEE